MVAAHTATATSSRSRGRSGLRRRPSRSSAASATLYSLSLLHAGFLLRPKRASANTNCAVSTALRTRTTSTCAHALDRWGAQRGRRGSLACALLCGRDLRRGRQLDRWQWQALLQLSQRLLGALAELDERASHALAVSARTLK